MNIKINRINGMKWCEFLLSIYAMIVLNNLVNTGQMMEQEKDTQILIMIMNKRQYTLFYKNNFKRAIRFTGKYE